MKTILALIVSLTVAFAFCALEAAIVMWLWNGIVAAIFSLPTISFWMAWGIMILCGILFKSCVHITTKKG